MVTYEQGRVIVAICWAAAIAMAIGIYGFGLPKAIALIVPFPLVMTCMIVATWLNSETRARWRQARSRKSSPAL